MKSEQSSQEVPGDMGGEKKLSPILQEIKDMDLNFDESEFKKAAHDDRGTSMETSTDAFLQIAKKLIEGERPGPNSIGAMSRILEREAMNDHPKIESFKAALEELKEMFDRE